MGSQRTEKMVEKGFFFLLNYKANEGIVTKKWDICLKKKIKLHIIVLQFKANA